MVRNVVFELIRRPFSGHAAYCVLSPGAAVIQLEDNVIAHKVSHIRPGDFADIDGTSKDIVDAWQAWIFGLGWIFVHYIVAFVEGDVDVASSTVVRGGILLKTAGSGRR